MSSIIATIMSYSKIRLIYFVSMFFFILLSVWNCIRTHGTALYDMLVPNYNNHYWDFFTSVYHNYNKVPYQEGVIYPSVANLVCFTISRFFSREKYEQGINALRDSQIGMFILLWFLLGTMLLIIALLYNDYVGNHSEKLLFLITLLFSAPFIREISKINVIIVSLLFTILFIDYKDDKRRYIRLLSFLCLALAVGIKIYPVFFGLFLLKEKKWKHAVVCVLVGIITFFLPFLFLGGMDGFNQMFFNIFNTASIFTDSGLGFKINISNTVNIVGELIGLNRSITQIMGNFINYLCLFSAVFAFFFINSKWKSVAIISLITLSYPPFSNSYAVLFMVPALIYFLNTEVRITCSNMLYVCLFVALFAPMSFGGQDIFPKMEGILRVNLFSFVESIAIFIMQVVLTTEGIIGGVKSIRSSRSQQSLQAVR